MFEDMKSKNIYRKEYNEFISKVENCVDGLTLELIKRDKNV